MYCFVVDLVVQVGVAGLQQRVCGDVIVGVEVVVAVVQVSEVAGKVGVNPRGAASRPGIPHIGTVNGGGHLSNSLAGNNRVVVGKNVAD